MIYTFKGSEGIEIGVERSGSLNFQNDLYLVPVSSHFVIIIGKKQKYFTSPHLSCLLSKFKEKEY